MASVGEPTSTAVRPGTVQAVSFDIWLTLVRSNPDFKGARAAAFHEVLGLGGSLEEFSAALREADRRTDRECEATGRDLGVAARVEATLAVLGAGRCLEEATVRRLLEAQDVLVARFPPLAMHEDLSELVANLAARVPVAVTSNTGMIPGVTMRRVLDRLGFGASLATATFSDEVGIAKPHPGIFRATLDALELPASDVLHVGDNPVADVEGAAAAGLSTALVGDAAPVQDLVATLVQQLEVVAP